jgi:hypothetical protein
MGLLDILAGKRKLDKPAADRLFAITTAYVTFETKLSLTSRGSAAIVFQSLATADFAAIVRDMTEVVTATAADSQTRVETSEDSYGFSWLILRGDDFDGLAVGINAVSAALQDAGYGERILCAVFAFEDSGPAHPRPVYWIYNYKRGYFYPFVPAGRAGSDMQRDSERELVLKAQIGADLPVEPELQRWFPLWGTPV